MSDKQRWTTEDFDELSWHDSHVHGFRITRSAKEGHGDLILDIDYILEWITEGKRFIFRIAPATLTFHCVYAFRMSLDYEEPITYGFGPFSIGDIVREKLVYPHGYSSYRWCMDVNYPAGKIEFTCNSFTQVLTGPAVSRDQCLAREGDGD